VREEITKENAERCKIKPYGVAERMKPWFEKEGEGMRGICGRISGGSKGKCKTSTGLTKGRVLSPSAQRDRGYVTEIKSNRRREVMRSYLSSRGGGTLAGFCSV